MANRSSATPFGEGAGGCQQRGRIRAFAASTRFRGLGRMSLRNTLTVIRRSPYVVAASGPTTAASVSRII